MRQTLLPIQEVARKLEIPAQYFEQLGPFTAKLKLELLADPGFQTRGKLILVTATSPTTSGEGKTVTAISLTQGLALLGKKVVITSREPSLGPVFGMKGGAAGGGLSRIEPSEKINLHFNGDFHAISSAHNLLAALIFVFRGHLIVDAVYMFLIGTLVGGWLGAMLILRLSPSVVRVVIIAVGVVTTVRLAITA